MRKYLRSALAGVVAVASVVALAACGSSSTPSGGGGGSSGTGTSSTSAKNGGTITIDAGTAPQSPDPGLDFTTQGTELYSVVNTALLTFKRGVQGVGGTQLEPALAKSLPKISDGGKTLTFQLRPGLKYSNGQPIKASDVPYALERDMKIPWQAASFISAFVVGAEAYAKGKAKTISGITADDSTGTITVHLMAPFAPMVDIFALPGTAPVPKSTPMKNLASTGAIGDGPYKWGPISPNHSYVLIKNTSFNGVPTVPSGHADKIVFNVNDNLVADAESVLNNQADVFDPGDTLPASNLAQIKSQASTRYQPIPTNSTFYFWFAVNKPPFNNIWARKAVLAALDLRALSRLDSGFLAEDCHLIPPGIQGHSSPSQCTSLTGHSPDGAPNMTLAKADMQKCGCSGAPITVWGEERTPRKQYVDYYTGVLNSLGFKAQEKIINSSVYFTTIGAPTLHPQTGFGDWVQDFPNPWDFMQLFTGSAGSSLNYGYVNDPHYNSSVSKLDQQDASQSSVASQWSALDNYAVGKGYYAAYGHEEFPKFYSDRMNFSAGVMSVEYQTDMTSLALK
jgi:peptide/nickel transport system substrate-binding protein